MPVRCVLRGVALGLVLAAGFPLFGSILRNSGFETGDLSGWNVTDPSQVLAIGATTIKASNGNTWNITPDGNSMAQVVGFSTSAAGLDSFFGLNAGTIETQIPGASYGDGIKQTVNALAGDQFSMSWSLVETDYPPYNDTVFAVVNQGNTNVLYQNLACLTGGCPHIVGNGGTQPWTAFTYTLPSDGLYTIGFGAINTQDSAFDPYLFLDGQPGSFVNPDAAPEPATYGLLVGGLLALWRIGQKRAVLRGSLEAACRRKVLCRRG